MEYKFLTVGDVHFGYYNPELLYEEFKLILRSIDEYKPDCVALEELFFQNNAKTAISVAQARGVIVLSAMEKVGALYEYTPLQIKQALTGIGRAEKQQVQYMVKCILNLKSVPKPDDAADALAVAITHSQSNQLLGSFDIK